MNLSGHLVWSVVATLVLTCLSAGSQGLGLTRMNFPYLLGTMLTPDRDRAKLVGVGLHLLVGWLLAMLYVAAFHALGEASVLWGLLAGGLHAAVVLLVGLPVLPALHPRMASEERGPTVVRQLEPPGFLGLHYGARTPLVVLLSHLAYGAILGGFYTW